MRKRWLANIIKETHCRPRGDLLVQGNILSHDGELLKQGQDGDQMSLYRDHHT